MTTLTTSVSLTGLPPRPALPTGVHHISEIMPSVLARHGLLLKQEPNSVHPPAPNAPDFFNVMLTSLESALAS